MAITLAEFRAQIEDVARPNRFLVTLGNPWSGVTVPTNFEYTASKATIPKVDLSGPTIKYRGTSLMLSGDYKKDPLVVTFWNERKWEARKFFEDWMASYFNYNLQDNARRSLSAMRFNTWIKIKQLGRSEADVLAEYEMHNVVPLEISEMELDHASENSVEEFTVTFHYSHFERLSPAGPASFA